MVTKATRRVSKTDNLTIFDKAEQHGRDKAKGDVALWECAKEASIAMWGDNPEIKFTGDAKAQDDQHVAACAKLASRFGVGAGGKVGEKGEKAYSDKLRNWLRKELFGKLDSIESEVAAYVAATGAVERGGRNFVALALSAGSRMRKDAKAKCDTAMLDAICAPKDGGSEPAKKDPASDARKAFAASIAAMREAKLLNGKAAKAHIDALVKLLKL